MWYLFPKKCLVTLRHASIEDPPSPLYPITTTASFLHLPANVYSSLRGGGVPELELKASHPFGNRIEMQVHLIRQPG